MKVVSWNMREASSPLRSKYYGKLYFDKAWDVLCAIEHKCHDLAGSALHLCGYSAYSANQLSHHYLGVIMIIRDLFCGSQVF